MFVQVLLPRATDVDYNVSHWHGHLFMVKRTSSTPNSELFITTLENPSKQHSLRAHRDDVKIEDVYVFNAHIALLERVNGLSQCHVFKLPDAASANNVRAFLPTQGYSLQRGVPAVYHAVPVLPVHLVWWTYELN